jgi:D-xylonolactonase
VWIGSEAALWFVDIKSGNLHRLDPATGAQRTYAVGGQPSFIVPAAEGGLLVGSGHAVRPFRDGALGDPVVTIDMPAHNRTNDATVDGAGRLWFGTMDDEEARASGAVHIVDGSGLRVVGGDCTITNGPAISPDGHHLYHVDTVDGTIWRFDIRDDTDLSDGAIFATIAKQDGAPDGVTIDSEGCLWVALWGGWQVRRYAPDGAARDRRAALRQRHQDRLRGAGAAHRLCHHRADRLVGCRSRGATARRWPVRLRRARPRTDAAGRKVRGVSAHYRVTGDWGTSLRIEHGMLIDRILGPGGGTRQQHGHGTGSRPPTTARRLNRDQAARSSNCR